MPGRGAPTGRRATIRDVAERAGVSKSLVSLVLRGEPMVREDKRRRVQQAADELGYRMNLAARSLSNVRSKTIGVLVADLRNPSLVDVIEPAGQVFEDEGLSTLLISAVTPSRRTRIDGRAIGALKDLRVEAMLVVGSVPDRKALAEVLGDMPVVVAAAGAEGLRADVVRNNDDLGMRLVVDYLVSAGHRAVAHLGGPCRILFETAYAVAECFVDAGLPEGVLSVLTGPGGALGDQLVADPRVRKVSFTGSTGIGERITQRAGVKKLSLELGASCPVVIMPDADLELASSAVAAGGFANAGQVCISVQRVIAHPAINGDFLDALVPKVEAIRFGDPSSPDTTMGTVISTAEAQRVEESIAAAAKDGARILTGGERDGAVIAPAVVADVDPASPFSQDELFGPAVAVSKAEDWESAIAQANGTAFGLAAGIFTGDVAGAIRAIREIDAGNIHINWTPLWRADLMPYGGLKGSGIGKEGPRTAVAEMTEEKTVVLHGRPW